jgi:hypothetical protein
MPMTIQRQCHEFVNEFSRRAGMGAFGLEEMLHFEPSDKRGRTVYQKIFNIHRPLRNAEHMLYGLSKSFKIDNRKIMVDGALFLTEKIPEPSFEKSHITRVDLNGTGGPVDAGKALMRPVCA